MHNFSNLSGSLLISFPHIQKQEFQKNVVFIFHHSHEGTMGFLMNHPLRPQEWPEPVQTMFPTIISESTLWGGPSDMTKAFLLHSQDYCTDETLLVQEKYGISPIREVNGITQLGCLNTLPKHTITLVGYMGWRPGQIEEELMNHDWISTTPTSELLFNTALEDKWACAFSTLGLRQDTALTYCPGSA